MDRYYALEKKENEADIMIFGDITSWPWAEEEVSAYMLSKQIADLDVETINVHINSYGGEVAEGLAIYNSLRQHGAKIRTYCDGFACSIASVIFMSGTERIMSNASLLMIHNPWTYTSGNAQKLRKTAENLDKMAQASVNAYMEHVSLSEEEIKQLLDNETWLSAQEGLEYGFATTISGTQQAKYSQSIRNNLVRMILEKQIEIVPEQLQKNPPENLKEEKTLMELFKGIARKEG